jgi:hypothetical protein
LVTSFVGEGPEGGVTVGSFESGPLAGVFTDAVVAEVEVVGVVEVEVASVLSALFSLPTPIVPDEEPEEPQPAIRTAAPSVARAMPGRRRACGVVRLK